MKVRAIEAFTDKQAGADRKVGDLFDCSGERAKELIGYKLVEKVSGSKDDLTEKDLEAKLKAITDRETAVATREDAVKTSEDALKEREKTN
jgi:flagellar basal body P-ring protein FlgI